MATLAHLSVFVTPIAVEGQGSTIIAGAFVGSEARLGVGGIVNCGAVVDHPSIVEAFGHLGVNASMFRGTLLGCGAKVVSGEVLQPGQVRKMSQP